MYSCADGDLALAEGPNECAVSLKFCLDSRGLRSQKGSWVALNEKFMWPLVMDAEHEVFGV